MSAALLPSVPRTPLPARLPPAIATPLGPLHFETVIGGRRLPAVPQRAGRLPSGATVFGWSGPEFELELLLCPFESPKLHEASRPTTCHGVLWRLAARAPLRQAALTVAYDRLPPGVDGGYDGGQGLDAITYRDERTLLTLGVPDDEDLCLRAGPDDEGGLPAAWAAYLDDVYARSPRLDWGVDHLDGERGLRWVLPPLAAGAHCLLHAAVSWCDAGPPPGPDEEEDAGTWFAVLVGPDPILRAAAGTA